jgi:hypothetical protein
MGLSLIRGLSSKGESVIGGTDDLIIPDQGEGDALDRVDNPYDNLDYSS